MTDTNIRYNISSFYDPVEMPGGWYHNHVENLKEIDLSYNSKFKNGQYDSRGFRKFFFNITKPACDVATKFVDLDTKDVILIPTRVGDEMKVWLMQRKLKQWLKETGFAHLLNEVAGLYPRYGHVVVKKHNRKWSSVLLHNLRFNPGGESILKGNFIYEVHLWTRGEIEEMNFRNQDAVRELLARPGEEFYVYECYDRQGTKWKRTIRADLFCTIQDGKIHRTTEAQLNREKDDYIPPLVLDETEVKKLPYRELIWEKMPGRAMGYGYVEYLRDNQVATNEAENLERKGLALKALQLFQTRDDIVGGSNVLSESENGDILTIESEVTPIAKENSDLAAFNATRARWDSNTERKTFTSDFSHGGDLPSRTPLGVANLQAGMTTSYFELKRENYGLFVKDLLIEDTIPDFKEETAKHHILTFLGSDEELEKLDKTILEIKVGEAIIDHANKTGFFPSKLMVQDARERILSQIKKNKNRYLKISDNFYDDAQFMLDILVTGEQMDVGVQSQVIQLALQTVGTNPAILQNKTSRTIFFKLLSMGGVSPVELNMLNEEVDQTPLPQAGSMSKIAPPEMGPIQTTNAL
jgi:hypothetical protein